MSQYSSLKNKLIKGDSIDELKKLDDNSVDLLCTDPPYGYGFMGKSWDKMLPPKEIFAESLRVLKPGAFAFVMSAPRSDVQYRMIKMLEDVGFEIGYTPIYWTYATGFPKASNIGKMVDKRKGLKGKVVGKKSAGYQKSISKSRVEQGYRKNLTNATNDIEIREPASDEAKQLNGSYGGYQPKPAIEVVIVAMKPMNQKGYLDQALDNQKGITWLDDCRIPFQDLSMEDKRLSGNGSWDTSKAGENIYNSGWGSERLKSSPLGRFAANLLVSDDVLNDGTTTKSVKRSPKNNKDNPDQMLYTPKKAIYSDENTYDDEGGFSRYYSLDAWWNSRLNKLPKEVQITFPFLRVAKAGKKEKNDGLDNFEVKQKDTRTDTGKGSFTEKGLQPGKNIHPTVKPLTLMSYLVTLGSRKGDVVLDPFMGSGTTPMACVTLDRIYIGIEREDEYFEIAEARVNKVEQPMKQWDKWL